MMYSSLIQATVVICGNSSLFSLIKEGLKRIFRLGNHTHMKVDGKGSVRLSIEGVSHLVFDVPDLKNNLVIIGQLQEKRLAILVKSNQCKISFVKGSHYLKQNDIK